MSDLEELRKRIDDIDGELLETLAKRMGVVDELGAYKKANGLDLRDDERFKQLLTDKLNRAEKLGLSQSFVAELYELIHKAALEREAGA